MSQKPDSGSANLQQTINDLRRELDQACRQRDEALARETAVAEVLEVINASPGDLAPVFDAMLQKAHHLLGVDQGGLCTYDGEHFRAVATRGLPEEMVEVVRRPFRGNAYHQQLVRGERYIHIPDMLALASDELDAVGKAGSAAGVRTTLLVPLRKDGALLGHISANRCDVRRFSDKQIALLENFAAQAVIAMENARLLTETREALQQQTATAEVLGVINSSPGDLAPVFEAILEKAHRVCGAAFGSLGIFEGERWRAVVQRGYRDPLASALREGGSSTDNQLLQELIAGAPLVHVADLGQLDIPIARANVAAGIHALLLVALRKDDALLGTISIARREARPFSEKEIALLENFAAQAVIAMENVRLLTETREALEQQTATAEVLGVINASPGDLAPVFDAMLEKALNLCEAAHGALYDYDGEVSHPLAARGAPAYVAFVRGRNPNPLPGGTPLSDAILSNKVVHVSDAQALEGYQIHPGFREMVNLGDMRTLLIVPLRKDQISLGAIAVYRQEVRPYSDEQVALLQNFAAQAVIAMENARLLCELRQRTKDLEESLEYQTATSNVLQVISRSTFELQPVLDTLIETAARLCVADGGAITIRDGEVYRFVAALGISEDLSDLQRNRLLTADIPHWRMLQERVSQGGFAHILDILAESEFRLEAAATIDKMRTILAVPMMRDGAVFGLLHFHRFRVEEFTERQIELVRTFADQAVIAMENVRLLGELRQRTEEVAELNRGLEVRVAEQVEELGRVGRLKRFLAPQLAELIVSQGDEKILESHRREIVVVFCDLRGYTAFTETAEPEEVLDFLREYHGALGPLVSQFEGTLDQFSGDGIMVFFNDPVPIPDAAERAVRMAIAMREAASALIFSWRRLGRDLGFGAGIAQGYATLGQIGFSERSGYTAIGTVCNVAARLCGEAKDGQILIGQRVAARLDNNITLEDIGSLALKGLMQPVVAFNVALAATQPALRIIEGGAPSSSV